MYPGARLAPDEREAIADLRSENPDLGQRTLAKKAVDNYMSGPGWVLRRRSRQAIYGAIRRHDAEQARRRAENQLVGAGASSTGVDDQHAPDPNVPDFPGQF